MKRYAFLFVLMICSLTSCEPDDICLAETPGTPQLILVFYDALQPEIKKEVPNLQVKGVGLDTDINNGTTDSIAVPLKINDDMTNVMFTKTDNNILLEESIRFTYISYDRFISRACGYQKNFTTLGAERSNPAIWIENLEILTDTISDIKTTHVKILH